MTEFTPIPGVWYKHPGHLVLFCFNPQMPDDPLPWTDNLGKQWRDLNSVKPPYDSNPTYTEAPAVDASRLEIAYNPHGKVRVDVQWGTLDDDNGGEFEPEVTYGEGYHWEPFTKEEAKERARLYKEPFVTRTVTTITHTTEWTEVTENE